MVLDQHYISLKNQVIKAERRVLKELGFCVHVKHPHKVNIKYLFESDRKSCGFSLVGGRVFKFILS